MDELSVVREAAVPPSALDDPRLAAALARLRAEIDGSTVRRGWRRAAGRRWTGRSGGPHAAAAAAVLVAALPTGSEPPAPPMMPAAQVLEMAASAALRKPDRRAPAGPVRLHAIRRPQR